MSNQTQADTPVGSVLNAQALSPDFGQHAASHGCIAPWSLHPRACAEACPGGCLRIRHTRQVASTKEKHGYC
jgi:hypothetical protein